MNRTATRRHISVKNPALLSPKERLAVAHQTIGSWKRSISSTTRGLASARRGLNRKVR